MKVNELADFIRTGHSVSFIIGAGASKSAGIPLASELINMIEDRYGHCLRSLSDEDKRNYGRVMRCLSDQERQELIEPLLKNAKINWGHLCLARIMQQPNVKRILSFNFDFLVEKAVSLMGDHLPVYDFGIAPADNVVGLAD